MYFDDHAPAHFHAFYGEYEVLVNINTLGVISGKLPGRALGLVMEWALVHQEELNELWQRARKSEPLGKIKPLE
jgi:hypothetical protein